jgi:hypothetical protein
MSALTCRSAHFAGCDVSSSEDGTVILLTYIAVGKMLQGVQIWPAYAHTVWCLCCLGTQCGAYAVLPQRVSYWQTVCCLCCLSTKYVVYVVLTQHMLHMLSCHKLCCLRCLSTKSVAYVVALIPIARESTFSPQLQQINSIDFTKTFSKTSASVSDWL